MNSKVELMSIQHKLYAQWNKIDDYKSLSHNKLTLTEYYILTDCMRELYKSGATSTYMTAVVDWFKRNGAKTEWDNDHINCVVTFGVEV